jgi:uncharacterized protein with von Willebrand factor type A (vWA) domain
MRTPRIENDSITMMSLLIDVEFADNPEPRVPTILLVDTSGSMSGKKIEALNHALEQLKSL